MRPDLFEEAVENPPWLLRIADGQDPDRLPEQLAAFIAHYCIQRGVGEQDFALLIRHEHRLRHVPQHARLHLELLLDAQALGHLLLH